MADKDGVAARAREAARLHDRRNSPGESALTLRRPRDAGAIRRSEPLEDKVVIVTPRNISKMTGTQKVLSISKTLAYFVTEIKTRDRGVEFPR